MAELILTEEEKAAALWSDLDDASLGRLVKKKIVTIENASEQLDRVNMYSAALLLICSVAEMNAGHGEFDIEGVTQSDRVFGDWRVVVTKIKEAK